ncbi:MAG: hypothetical protein LBF95_05320 [Treponema sp.]|jgi:hypothetical protein|nr:hypothetical protein [Treponema sp.]
MKRVSAALIFGLLVSLFCHAQVQTGNASYNSSKTGQTISHSSLSFNTRVKVTNLRNNMSTEAVVNGRIEISSTRIADIAQSVGDTLQMSKTGMTPVQIEVLHPESAQSASAQSEPAQAAPVQTPPAQTAPARAAQPVPVQQPAPARQPAAAARTSSPPAAAAQPVSETAVQTQPDQPVPVETLTEIRYVPVSAACPGMICLVILILLILVIVLLVIILILMLRFRPWPWYYPIWLRRHFRYTKRRL